MWMKKTKHFFQTLIEGNKLTPSSKAQRLLTSCSLWLNTSWRASITLWRMFSISVTLYKRKHTMEISSYVHAFLYHSPLDVKSSAGSKDLHHHDLARDKTPVEGRGMNVPCTSASGFKPWWIQLVIGCVPDWLPSWIPLTGLAADIKTPLQTWTLESILPKTRQTPTPAQKVIICLP